MEDVEAVFAALGDRDFVAFLLESFAKGLRQLRLVFHYQDTHALII
jgi:hypothetical protein